MPRGNEASRLVGEGAQFSQYHERGQSLAVRHGIDNPHQASVWGPGQKRYKKEVGLELWSSSLSSFHITRGQESHTGNLIESKPCVPRAHCVAASSALANNITTFPKISRPPVSFAQTSSSILGFTVHHAFSPDTSLVFPSYPSPQCTGQRCSLHTTLTTSALSPPISISTASRLECQHISGAIVDFRKLCRQCDQRLRARQWWIVRSRSPGHAQ